MQLVTRDCMLCKYLLLGEGRTTKPTMFAVNQQVRPTEKIKHKESDTESMACTCKHCGFPLYWRQRAWHDAAKLLPLSLRMSTD